MGIETAIIASAIIGAGASAYSSKKQSKAAEGAREDAKRAAQEEKTAQEKEKKGQNQATKDYYTNLRRGNVNLLNPTKDQKLG